MNEKLSRHQYYMTNHYYTVLSVLFAIVILSIIFSFPAVIPGLALITSGIVLLYGDKSYRRYRDL